MEYYIGQIFIDEYPFEAANWCNNNNCYIDEIQSLDGHKRFQIFQIPPITPEERREKFLKDFFKVGDIGYYRKKPKGYQSAIESITVAERMCAKNNGLPANTLIFYPEPDFTNEQQCTEEWLVANQIKLPNMTTEQFDNLFIAFVTAWNLEEH